ncbi:hypothetical protein CBL_00295 [Carabus blaptoides fortunei]
MTHLVTHRAFVTRRRTHGPRLYWSRAKSLQQLCTPPVSFHNLTLDARMKGRKLNAEERTPPPLLLLPNGEQRGRYMGTEVELKTKERLGCGWKTARQVSGVT